MALITNLTTQSAASDYTIEFKLNGIYTGLTTPRLGVDGLYIIPVNSEIVNVFIYSMTPGSSSSTMVDLLLKPFNSGTFTSIFTTKPSMSSTHAAAAWVGVGDTITGATAPVLNASAASVAAKSALRFDIRTIMGGAPADLGVILHMRVL